MTMGRTEWALLVLLSVLWGGVFFLNEIALTAFEPLTVVLGRVGLAAIALTAILPVLGVRLPRRLSMWGAYLVMGALNNALPFILIVWGQVHIDSGLAAILNATTPIFTVVMAHVVTHDDRLTIGRAIGVALGVAGVAALMGPDTVGAWSWHSVGQLAILGAAISYACAGIFGRRFRGQSPVAAATGMLWGSTLIMIPVTLAVEAPWRAPMVLEPWLALLGLAVAGSAAAYVVYFALLARAGATNLLLVTLLMPVIATLLGIVGLDEQVSWNAWLGMGLVLGGLAVMDGRLLRRAGRVVGWTEIERPTCPNPHGSRGA